MSGARAKRRAVALLAALLALGAGHALGAAPAAACGHCLEDKIAATYDYAVLAAAARHGHVVVFAELRGPAAGASPALRAWVRRALAALPGVDPGTVRVSLDPPAASFACDPARGAPARLVAAASPRLAAKGLSLVTLKIDPGPRAARKSG